MRRAALCVLLCLVSGCAGARSVAYHGYDWMMRVPDAAPLVVGVCAGNSIAYIVPAAGGVVLVDAGFDETGAALREAVGDRRVLAVLLTHGHLDHRAGAHVFGAPVYVGRGDVDLVRGVGHSRSMLGAVGDLLTLPDPPPVPRELYAVDDGAVVHGLRAVALPGHTPGSTAWLVDGLLFTGDALQQVKPHELFVGPAPFSDDVRAGHRSVRALRDVPFHTVLDGHYGVTTNARRPVRAVVEREHDGDEAMYSSPLPRAVRCSAP